MRERKFRAFQDNEMLVSPISSNYGLYRFFGMLYEDTPIMQFTGLKDKNGVDIYEGDVLKDPNQRERRPRDKGHGYYIVQYSNGGYVTETYNGSFLVRPSLSNKNSILEVIGNIHENKELAQPISKQP